MRLQETVPIRHAPEGVRSTRDTIRAWMEGWSLPIDHGLVVLLLSEAVSNAVEHGAAPASVRIRWEGAVLKVSVRDALVSSLPVLQSADGQAETGRGLALLEALADRWGVDVTTGSKTVWFEVSPAALDDDVLAAHLQLWQDEVEPV